MSASDRHPRVAAAEGERERGAVGEVQLDVEISVVSTDNRELLEKCLRSLPDACQGLQWHATVIDNASTDGTAEMVERDFPWASQLRNERRLGFSANHNQVLRHVLKDDAARYVLILNEDTELEPGAVTQLVRFGDAHRDVGVLGPQLYGPDGERQPSLFRFPRGWAQVRGTLLPGRKFRPTNRGWLNGSCLLVRVLALDAVGLLDERFFIFYEDTDLGYRMARAGWASTVVETSRIVHHAHQTVSRPVYGSAMERQMLRSRYLYFEKYKGRRYATLLVRATQAALWARAAKAWVESQVRPTRGDDHAAGLAGLARYNASREPALR